MTKAEKAAAIAAIKARLYQLFPFTAEWARVARELWAVEDAPTVD